MTRTLTLVAALATMLASGRLSAGADRASGGADHAAVAERAADARAYLATIRPAPELQVFLDRTMAELMAADPQLRRVDVRVALLDLGDGERDGGGGRDAGHGGGNAGDASGAPRLADYHGALPIYPASVVKFVYLMAAYAWQEQGRLRIDDGLDRQITEMIRVSSNQATQRVFARLTGTEPGPALPPDAYAAFRERRLAVERWLETLGITDLHCVNPTYDGDGDVFGRDEQFLRDRTVPGALPSHGNEFPNRQAMTAIGTVKLLALLATDRALSPADSATARHRMKRDPREQPHLAHRIAGGAARLPGLEAYAKSGTWGPIYADAGIVRHVSGRAFALAVFTEGRPPYRGDFIADLTARTAAHLLLAPAAAASAVDGDRPVPPSDAPKRR